MLTTPDADVVRRDPGLPGLAVVLDPDRLAGVMRRLMPRLEVAACRVVHVRYRPHDHCRAECRLMARDREIEIGVHACAPDEIAAWRGNGKGARRFVLDDLALIVTVFPDDPALVGLAPLEEAERRPQILRDLIPGRPDLWQGKLRRLRYRPERRYAAEVRSGGRSALVKSYTRKAFHRSRTNGRGFRSRGTLRVARLLGASEPHRLLAFEWLPGRLLREICQESNRAGAAVAMSGAALAELHAQAPEGLEPWTRYAELADLGSICSELVFLAPGLSRRVEEVGTRLAEHLAASRPKDGPIHGDFSPNQVLVDADAAAIIDLDLACRGDSGDDLGNFLACVERMGLRGEIPRARVDAIRAALLDGYARTAGRLPGSVPFYTALQTFRRARFPFRTRETEWPDRMEALIDRAEAILSAEVGP
jgi:tRNA A-37 threonylcarbamoyl transferase component Bud32